MFSELAQRLSQEIQKALPLIENLIPKQELHKALQTALSKLNLVTREEFDAQTAVLQRTRMKLEELERQYAELENICTKFEQSKI
ncbi:MAG: accessory factor UbiK family protein [Moraxellaceae bacterium]|nr:MAG: accessory factor UbiK family protein [Moraxellaceae bacterium]